MSEATQFDMGPLRDLLRILADGEFHSGEELGVAISVSRAAVWKHLQKLQGLGVKLLSVKGRGYCIKGGIDLLDVQKISAQTSLVRPVKIQVFSQINSTNSYLMRADKPAYQACFAELQTAGRGRRGRNWVSPFAQNIYFSLSWNFNSGIAAVEGLSLAIGLSLLRALNYFGVSGLELKWPNDVLHQKRKLAGVLIEMNGDPAGNCKVVVGVGLNIAMAKEGSDLIDQPWIDLQTLAQEQVFALPSRNQMAAVLLSEMVAMMNTYDQTGFTVYRDAWQAVCAYKGEKVRLNTGSQLYLGVLLGVNEIGALRLGTESGEMLFHGGEVSVRSAP